MLTKQKISEVEIAAAVVAHLQTQGLKVRQEVLCVLPDHGQVCADIVACKTDETGEWFTVVEVKRRLDETLESQCRRWIGFAHRIVAAYLLSNRGEKKYARANRLTYIGIARHLISHGGVWHTVDGNHFANADTRLIAAAFHSSTGEHDPAAGSAAAKRMTGARCQWEPLRIFLQDEFRHSAKAAAKDGREFHKPNHWWKHIRRQFPSLCSLTVAQVRRAIDRQECMGVGYEVVDGITRIFAKDSQ